MRDPIPLTEIWERSGDIFQKKRRKTALYILAEISGFYSLQDNSLNARIFIRDASTKQNFPRNVEKVKMSESLYTQIIPKI